MKKEIMNTATQIDISDAKLADIHAELRQYVDNSRNLQSVGINLLGIEHRDILNETKSMWAAFVTIRNKPNEKKLTPDDMTGIVGIFKKEEKDGSGRLKGSWINSRIQAQSAHRRFWLPKCHNHHQAWIWRQQQSHSTPVSGPQHTVPCRALCCGFRSSSGIDLR